MKNAHNTREAAEPVSIGIIGAGDIVRAVHLPVLLASSVAKVAWVADIDADRARSLGAAYKVPSLTVPKDLSQLPPADVFLLAIPFAFRRPYFDALRDRDCAIYVEKPFAVHVDEHREISGGFPDYALASGLMMRSWGPNLAIRNVITSHLFGRLETVRFGYGHPGMVTQGRYYLDRSSGGGGMLGELAIHGIDTTLFVSGAQSAQVEAAKVVRDGDLEVHTEARLQLQMDCEEPVSCEITVSALTDTIDGMEFEFSDAIVSYPLLGQGYSLLGEQVDLVPLIHPKRTGESFHLQPIGGEYYPFTRAQMFHEYWRRFLDGVRQKQANETSAASSILTTEVIQGVLQRSGPAEKVLS